MADKKPELKIKQQTNDGEVELVGSKDSLDQFKFDNSTKNKSIKAKDAADAVAFETEKAKAKAEKARVSQGIKKRSQVSGVNQERIEKLTSEVLDLLEATEAKLMTYDYNHRKTNKELYSGLLENINNDYDALSDTSTHSITSSELAALKHKYTTFKWKHMTKSLFNSFNSTEIAFYAIPTIFLVISIILMLGVLIG